MRGDDTGTSSRRTRTALLVLAASQLFFTLQATLLFPLGPALAHDLHFSVAKLGYLNAAFLASACVTGLAGAFVLDSFDRRRATVFTLCGVALCAGLVAACTSLPQLVMVRLGSGFFGGPLIALSLATVSDSFPSDERGAALGIVSRGSAIALVAGIPLSLLLSDGIGWRGTMMTVGLAGILFALAAWRWLPLALNRPAPVRLAILWEQLRLIVGRRSTGVAMLFNALNSCIVMVLAANIAPYLVGNRGIGTEQFKFVWTLGGISALVGASLFGRLGDRLGSSATLIVLLAGSVASYALLFIAPAFPIPFLVTFILYNLTGSGRVVVTNLVLSNVAKADERGRFFILVSSAAQAAAALAIFGASRLLVVGDHDRFENIDQLGWLVTLVAIATATIGIMLDRSTRRRTGAAREPRLAMSWRKECKR